MSATEALLTEVEGYVYSPDAEEQGDPFAANLGSEPELRPDELLCEVTRLTYYHKLPHSPHVDRQGRPI